MSFQRRVFGSACLNARSVRGEARPGLANKLDTGPIACERYKRVQAEEWGTSVSRRLPAIWKERASALRACRDDFCVLRADHGNKANLARGSDDVFSDIGAVRPVADVFRKRVLLDVACAVTRLRSKRHKRHRNPFSWRDTTNCRRAITNGRRCGSSVDFEASCAPRVPRSIDAGPWRSSDEPRTGADDNGTSNDRNVSANCVVILMRDGLAFVRRSRRS